MTTYLIAWVLLGGNIPLYFRTESDCHRYAESSLVGQAHVSCQKTGPVTIREFTQPPGTGCKGETCAGDISGQSASG